MFLIDVLYIFLLLESIFSWTFAFSKAPGTLILKIGIPELTDNCFTEECQYQLDLCLGSGRSPDERCFWVPVKKFSGQFSLNQDYLVEQPFEVDNIRSSFYFNANFTFQSYNKAFKTILFKDNLIHYAALSGTHRVSLHSEKFISMSIEIDVKCKSGYYPPFQCAKFCLGVPGVYECDINGTLICLEGYVLSSGFDQCIKDSCKSSFGICQNNSTCINELNSIRCSCQPYYSGSTCEIWDPCREHKCENRGICIQRINVNDYICQCIENYYGKYCENIEDPCREIRCPSESFCHKRENDVICVTSTEKPTAPFVVSDWIPSKKRIDSTLWNKILITTKIYNSDLKSKETLIQYPPQRDLTTIAIIIFLLVFMICCFAVTFWIQMNRYFQKRRKCDIYPRFPIMPSLISLRTYRNSDGFIKRWRSMDDGVFNIWHHSNNDQFPTLSCRSMMNSLGRPDNGYNTQRYIQRNEQQNPRIRTPITTQPKESNSVDVSLNVLEIPEREINNLESHCRDPTNAENDELLIL